MQNIFHVKQNIDNASHMKKEHLVLPYAHTGNYINECIQLFLHII